MLGCLTKTVQELRRLPPSGIVSVLRSESSRLEVTKSLLNILFNICLSKSIRLSERLKRAFAAEEPLILRLLEGVKSSGTQGLGRKKQLLLRRPELVRLIASACPRRLAE